MESNGKAIEVYAPGSVEAYQPRNYEEAMRLAVTYAKSQLLGEVRSPEAAMLIMATGAELGIPPTAALRGIYIVKGRPFLAADLMVAICLKRADLCEYFSCLETTAERATYETKRKGSQPTKITFTIEDAKRAGLDRNETYLKYPSDMLRHRAAAKLARMTFPDLTMGLYCREEAEDDEQPRDMRGPNVIDAPFEIMPAPPKAEPAPPPEPARPGTSHGWTAPPVSFGEIPPANDAPPKPAAPEVPLADRAKAWRIDFASAVTVADCDKVRRDVKKHCPESDPIWEEMKALYKARVYRLRNPGSANPEDVIT